MDQYPVCTTFCLFVTSVLPPFFHTAHCESILQMCHDHPKCPTEPKHCMCCCLVGGSVGMTHGASYHKERLQDLRSWACQVT